MNTNNGNDPMLCSFNSEEWTKFITTSSASPSPIPHLAVPHSSSNAFTISVEGLLSPEPNLTMSDLASMWPNERKRVTSIKMEEDESFTGSPYSTAEEVDAGDMDMDEMDIGSSATIAEVKTEIEDQEYDDIAMVSSVDSHHYNHSETNIFHLSESEARQFVDEQFQKIAFVPNPKQSQRAKIEYILTKSDCTDYSVDTIQNFDKKSSESARACAKIVQNIPQRYRWECVRPEDIPCCYTIVADCKKVSCRDKPPRPMNAFMIWAQGARRLINELCPKMQNALISEALGFYWRQKSDAFKKKFEQEKVKLRRFHNVEFPEYKYKPKTKVQKAKEKQELSLSKAKMRANLKREKMQQAEESNLYRRRTSAKCGRPRKVKSSQNVKEGKNSSVDFSPLSETPVKMSPTKPAIKDMLTLKILNDRRSKEVVNTLPRSHDTVHSAFGQLSPLEVDSPAGVCDIFDELGNIETTRQEQGHRDKDTSGKSMPSSVYDTPANTPPVDADEEIHLLPIHSQAVSVSSPLPTMPTQSALHKPCSSGVHTTPKQILMPSLSAMLSSPSRTAPSVINTHSLSAVGFLSKTSLSSAMASVSRAKVTSQMNEELLTFVAEALAPIIPSKPNSAMAKVSTGNVNDTNNNNSDVNNNRPSDDNNNNISLPPSYAASVMSSKRNNFFNEFSDLDTVALDLSVPLLSDDDMRSLLNTL